jgi:hypothetical protein
VTARLYGRTVAVTLARPLADGATGYFAQAPNAIRVTDLRVSFTVEKHLGDEPNNAQVIVYNLAAATRAELQRKPLYVRLEAGYDSDLQRLVEGDMTWTKSMLTGVDWQTSIDVGDGTRAIRHARVSRSFKGGVDAKAVLTDIAGTMGLKVPKNVEGAVELAEQFVSGMTLEGPSRKQMTKVLDRAGMSWSVQDGRLQILRANETRPDQAILVTPDTGLIGSPDFGAPRSPDEPPTLTAKMLLYPGLTPGGKVAVKTRSIDGIFRVTRLRHTGDTHGPAWYTDFEATPV